MASVCWSPPFGWNRWRTRPRAALIQHASSRAARRYLDPAGKQLRVAPVFADARLVSFTRTQRRLRGPDAYFCRHRASPDPRVRIGVERFARRL